MISDDAPDPRNGKIIQCHVLARTLWVPWAGSLAGPWREAPCHYAAGLHHPHQYPIFGASPYNQRGLDKSFCSLRRAALLSFSAASFVSSLAGGPHRPLRCYYFTPPLRDIARVCAASRESWIVVRKYSRLLSFSLFCICPRMFSAASKHARITRPRLLTLFRAKYRKGCLYKCTELCENCICDVCANALRLFVKWSSPYSTLFTAFWIMRTYVIHDLFLVEYFSECFFERCRGIIIDRARIDLKWF